MRAATDLCVFVSYGSFTEMADEPSILLRTYRSIMLAYRSQIHRTKPDRFTDLLASTYTELSTTNSAWPHHHGLSTTLLSMRTNREVNQT